MSSVYVCRECGYTFPAELSQLIESNVQVYCERCGSPFILEGVKFKPAPTPYIRKKKLDHIISEKKSSKLENFIQFLNKISSIPLFIFTCVSFGLIAEIAVNWDLIGIILFERISQGMISLILLIFDRNYIAKKVKEKKFNDIFLDSFCWGILGCILYGLGVIILIKGIFIIIYVISDSKNKDLKPFDFGLYAKNSLNYISTKAGFLIILFGIYTIYSDQIYIAKYWDAILDLPFNIEIPTTLLFYFGFFLVTLAILIIDSRIKAEIAEKKKLEFSDSLKFFFLGIFGLFFYAAGIFILLKGILIFFLCFRKPTEQIQKIPTVTKPAYYAPIPPIPPTPPTPSYKKIEPSEMVALEEKEIEIKTIEPPIKTQVADEEKIRKEPEKVEEVIVKEFEEIPLIVDEEERAKRKLEYELKLHESLLPVKDDKDKKLVREYFSKIFSVLSKDLRKQIKDLKISKEEKRELLAELAFLTKEEQVKYIDAIASLYREIPKKLINRIRKLPNVKPEHYDKIVEQLKFMDVEEQIKFVQFLEENT
ncbi:MAG: hypothetical protein ACFE9Q_04440 [Candidatus Hodarchaeota archaeon]